jgi:hypothetical protein
MKYLDENLAMRRSGLQKHPFRFATLTMLVTIAGVAVFCRENARELAVAAALVGSNGRIEPHPPLS